MYQVLTKKAPPERPESIPSGLPNADKIWELLLRCWSYEPGARPSATDVADSMKKTWISVPISCNMPLKEVVQQLELHGCKNVTNLTDLAKLTVSRLAISHGTFSDIYSSNLTNGARVALKRMRSLADRASERKIIKHLAREIYALSKCNHPNILQLVGFAEYRGHLMLVSPWYENGSFSRYISRKNTNVDRCALSAQVASGVVYLHKQGIVHGNIKGSNILVAPDHTAKLAGFGSATLEDYTLQFTATTSSPIFSLRWAAPEIVEGSADRTTHADVYSLGMTILVSRHNAVT
ncbi:hypothetical protein OPQ81_000800 [Rhizoctonia solani]|nr:hypothetical protein OPQ81_000800 [Rhizoctonia solani]